MPNLKPLLTSLLLTSSLLSCAAAKQDVIKQDSILVPEANPPITKPAPTSNFGDTEPTFNQNLQDNPPLPTEDGAVPITVEPPPADTTQEEVSAVTYPYLVMRPTGKVNSYGNPIYQVAIFNNGRLVSSVNAVTGRAHTQNRNRNVAGTEAPLPNGQYRVATNWVGGTDPEVGGRFLPITPLFSTGRSALGFHVDPSYNKNKKEDGTAGCIGLTTTAERDLLFKFVQEYKPRYLKVAI
jgi:hypothetical protein